MADGAASSNQSTTGPDEREAAASLNVGERQKRLRRFWRSIPSAPRCKMCHRPFGGVGGPVMRRMGLGPWRGNPKYCRGCFRDLYRRRSGAEIECSLLFADVRDSTALAETMRPAEYRRVLDRFYEASFDVLVARDAFVDKFVGDEVIAIFVPAMTDGLHALDAIYAGIELLRATGHADGTPWAPIGIGVSTGLAYVGAVGTDEHVEFTALGDVVNVAARLSAAAGPGELLATTEAIAAARVSGDKFEHRMLGLKGKSERVGVVVLSPSTLLTPLAGEPVGTRDTA